MESTVRERELPLEREFLFRIRSRVASTLGCMYKAKIAYFFLAPAFILMLTFIAYPLVKSLILSLYEWNGITAPDFIGLLNFELLFQDKTFWLALRNNVTFSALTTGGTVIIGFLLAVAIERRVRGWSLFKIVYFLPVMMSMTVVGLLWGRIYDPTFGPINLVLKALGLANPPVWLGEPRTSLYAVIAVTIWQYSGFPMIIFLAAMEGIPADLHDAASIDGVNTWQRLRHITFPMVKRVAAVVIMLQIIFSFKVFDIVWVMTMGGPGEASTVLGIYLYRTAFRYTQFGYGAAVAVVMTVIIFVISIIYLQFIRPEQIEY